MKKGYRYEIPVRWRGFDMNVSNTPLLNAGTESNVSSTAATPLLGTESGALVKSTPDVPSMSSLLNPTEEQVVSASVTPKRQLLLGFDASRNRD